MTLTEKLLLTISIFALFIWAGTYTFNHIDAWVGIASFIVFIIIFIRIIKYLFKIKNNPNKKIKK